MFGRFQKSGLISIKCFPLPLCEHTWAPCAQCLFFVSILLRAMPIFLDLTAAVFNTLFLSSWNLTIRMFLHLNVLYFSPACFIAFKPIWFLKGTGERFMCKNCTGLLMGWIYVYHQPYPNPRFDVLSHRPLLFTPLHSLCSIGTSPTLSDTSSNFVKMPDMYVMVCCYCDLLHFTVNLGVGWLTVHGLWLQVILGTLLAALVPVVGFNAVMTSEHFASFLVWLLPLPVDVPH